MPSLPPYSQTHAKGDAVPELEGIGGERLIHRSEEQSVCRYGGKRLALCRLRCYYAWWLTKQNFDGCFLVTSAAGAD